MRTETQIRDELATGQANYHDIAQTAPEPELRRISNNLKTLREELSALLSAGAKDCPTCKTKPHGMLKTPAHFDRGEEKPPTYEVGCLTCPLRARSYTIERAVAAWNALK